MNRRPRLPMADRNAILALARDPSLTFEEIGREVGVSATSAWRYGHEVRADVLAAANARPAPRIGRTPAAAAPPLPSQGERRQERLDRLWRALDVHARLLEAAEEPDPAALKTVVDVLERLERLEASARPAPSRQTLEKAEKDMTPEELEEVYADLARAFQEVLGIDPDVPGTAEPSGSARPSEAG